MKRTIGGAALLSATAAILVLSAPAAAQSRVADKLAAAKSLACNFPTMTVGDWGATGPAGQIKPAKLAVRFADIDTDEGTAVAIGTFGPSDIIVKLSVGTLHFVQSFREGPLYATTIFPFEVRPDVLRAVHTRHEYTSVSLPGFTSRPEQYYGECEIGK